MWGFPRALSDHPQARAVLLQGSVELSQVFAQDPLQFVVEHAPKLLLHLL